MNAADMQRHRANYKYTTALVDKQIRLLRVKDAVGDGIRGSLEVYELASAPSFEAMSYRWGEPNKSHTITIEEETGGRPGGATLAVTQSAYELLQQQQSSAEKPYIWIDSICINQADEAEKTRQVRIMGDIYSQASRVVIWLGHAPDADIAWWFFGKMLVEHEKKIPQDLLDAANLGIKELGGDQHPGWRALVSMLTNSYWWRVWIVQEIVLARHVVICYGGFSWGWDAFAEIISELTNKKNGLLQKLDISVGMAMTPGHAIGQICSINRLRRRYRRGTRLSLAEIVLDFRSSQASLDKDHVFGFHGISSDAQNPALLPDYSKSALQVFREAVVQSLRDGPQEMPFALFAVAGVAHIRSTGTDEPPWPSWVPELQLLSRDEKPAPSICGLAAYKAGRPDIRCPRVSRPSSDNELVIEGIIIDKIAEVTKLPPVDVSKFTSIEDLHATARMILDQIARVKEARELTETACAKTYPNGQPREEAFWRTQMADRSPQSYPAEPEYGEYFQMTLDAEESDCKGLLGLDRAAMLGIPPQFAGLLEQSQSSIKPMASGGKASEKTIVALERLLSPLPVRMYLSLDLLNNRRRLLRELAAAADLPRWAEDELASHRPGCPPANTEAAGRALQELTKRVHGAATMFDEQTLRRVVLLQGYFFSGIEVDPSDDVIDSMRRFGETRRRWNEVAQTKRVSMMITTAAGSRLFGVTSDGYMGLVPTDTRPGDVFCIFSGARTPHVLRPVPACSNGNETQYQIVGEAYLHGVMDGQFFTTRQESVSAVHIV